MTELLVFLNSICLILVFILAFILHKEIEELENDFNFLYKNIKEIKNDIRGMKI